jgi:hypothetical protein
MRSLRLCIARLHRRYVRFARTLKPRQSSSHGAFLNGGSMGRTGRKENDELGTIPSERCRSFAILEQLQPIAIINDMNFGYYL